MSHEGITREASPGASQAPVRVLQNSGFHVLSINDSERLEIRRLLIAAGLFP